MRGHSFKFDPVLIECATADDLVANSAWVEKTSLVSGKWRPDAAGQIAPYPIHVRTQRMVRVDEGAGCCTEKSEDAVLELLGITAAKQMCDLFYLQFPLEQGKQVARLEAGELSPGALRQNDWHCELTRLWGLHPWFEGWAVGGLDPKTREYPRTKSFATAAWPVGLAADLVVAAGDAKKRVAWKESGEPWKAEWPLPRRLTKQEEEHKTLRKDFFANTAGHRRPAAVAPEQQRPARRQRRNPGSDEARPDYRNAQRASGRGDPVANLPAEMAARKAAKNQAAAVAASAAVAAVEKRDRKRRMDRERRAATKVKKAAAAEAAAAAGDVMEEDEL